MPTIETIATTDRQGTPEMKVVPRDEAPLYCLTMSPSVAGGAVLAGAVLTLLFGWIAYAMLADDDTTFRSTLPMILAVLVLASGTLVAWKNRRWLQQDPAPEGKLVPVPPPAPPRPSRAERKAARAAQAEQMRTETAEAASAAPVAEKTRGRFRTGRRHESSVQAPLPDGQPVVHAPIVARTPVFDESPTLTEAPARPTRGASPQAPPASQPEPPVVVLPTSAVLPGHAAPAAEPAPHEAGAAEAGAAEAGAQVPVPETVAPAEFAMPTLESSDERAPDWFAPVKPPTGHGMGPAPTDTDTEADTGTGTGTEAAAAGDPSDDDSAPAGVTAKRRTVSLQPTGSPKRPAGTRNRP